jgi:antibiotic biosynthesis monooxygenase (ABM) superfamily enzyme
MVKKELVLIAVKDKKPVSRRFSKEIVAFVVRKDTTQLTVGSQIETKISALPTTSLMQVKLINLMIRKRFIAPIVTKMFAPWIAVSERSEMKRKLTNRVMKV